MLKFLFIDIVTCITLIRYCKPFASATPPPLISSVIDVIYDCLGQIKLQNEEEGRGD